MRDDTPTVYLLAGPPGSGKSTYAKALEAEGVVRLAIDEEIRARHGTSGDKPGKVFENSSDAEGNWLADVLSGLNARLVDHVEAGRDVVLDHGLGELEEREFYKRLVEEHGAQWCMIHFTVDHTELIQRLEQRVAAQTTTSG